MFIAAHGDGFRRQFSDGLSQMLSADGLGAFILVLANSLQGDELRQPLLHILEENFDQGLPTTAARCPECGNNLDYWWLRQLRSADESETRFFKCTKCGATWREYD